MGGLTRKLFLGFGGVVAVIVSVGAVLIVFLTLHSRTLEVVLRENYDSVVYCDRMKEALDEGLAIAQSRLNLTAAESGSASTLAEARARFEADAKREIGNVTLPGEGERSQQIWLSGTACFDAIDRLAGDTPPAVKAAFYQTVVFPHYQTTCRVVGEVSQMNLANLAEVNGHVRNSLLTIRNTVATFTLVGLALSVVIVGITARRIIRPLLQLTASVRQVESGDLDSMVSIASRDEIGELAAAFNSMAARLREFRRLDHQRLFRTQQTTQAAIDSLPDAVAVLTPEGKIEIANRTAQVHFGLAPGADIHTAQPAWAKTLFEPVVATGRPQLPDGYRTAIQIFDESGERFLLPRAMPMMDVRGQLMGVTLVLVEVTHLRRADEFKSGLLATVSHELKTPLTSLRMAVHLVLDQRLGGLNDRQVTLLSNAREASERLVKTVDDILTIGRVESGRARLDVLAWPAQEIVTRAMALVETAAADRQVQIHLDLPKEPLTVRADLTLVACALSNLLSNAIKFSPRTSTVRLEVRICDAGDRPEGGGGAIRFSVTDEGAGIAEEYQQSVFDKFFRIVAPGGGGPTGAGLGLSIAKEIVQLHGGTIELKSAVGKGSCFGFVLPR